jgi:hypothetical protein
VLTQPFFSIQQNVSLLVSSCLATTLRVFSDHILLLLSPKKCCPTSLYPFLLVVEGARELGLKVRKQQGFEHPCPSPKAEEIRIDP